jgi:hypothetical protein
MRNMFMLWQPIEDLPSNWQDLASSELPPLVTVYEQADRLRESGEFQSFNEKLRREIAIETGIIERLYRVCKVVCVKRIYSKFLRCKFD